MNKMITLVIFSVGILFGLSAIAGQVFQYKDDKGNSYLSQTILPQYAKQGYRILDAQGRLVREVAPMSEASSAPKVLPPATPVAVTATKSETVASPVVAGMDDQKLLQLFKSPQDATHFRDRKLIELDTAIMFSQTKLDQLRSEQKAKIAEAAGFEFNGKAVPKGLVQDFLARKKIIQQAEAALLLKKQERQATQAEWESNVQRLQKIAPILSNTP